MKPEDVKGLAMLTQIGITVVVCIAIGFFIGRFLDGFFNTSPWLLLLFTLFGIGAAFKAVYDIASKY